MSFVQMWKNLDFFVVKFRLVSFSVYFFYHCYHYHYHVALMKTLVFKAYLIWMDAGWTRYHTTTKFRHAYMKFNGAYMYMYWNLVTLDMYKRKHLVMSKKNNCWCTLLLLIYGWATTKFSSDMGLSNKAWDK